MASYAALVRVLLTCVSVLIVLLDYLIPRLTMLSSHGPALLASGLFLVYAVATFFCVRREWISVEAYFPVAAVLDVVFSAGLLITTDGYLSPFSLWLVIAVVAAAPSGRRFLPWVTAGMGLLVHCLIAMIPQSQPLDSAVFIVRTGFLFGVASVLSTISTYQSRQSQVLAFMEEVGRRFADARTREEACRTLLELVTARLRADGVSITLSDGENVDSGQIENSPLQTTAHISAGGRSFGSLRVWRSAPLARAEDSLTRLCCDRAGSALLRIDLSESLVRSAAAAERLRVSDHLHDTYVQTLAALDLRTEAVLRRMTPGGDGTADELRQIKDLIRVAGRQAREVTEILCNPLPPGPDAVRAVLSERWLGDSDVEIAPEVELSDERWRAVEMFVREGLNNVAKHARKAKKITLHITEESGDITCTLMDDGRAFSAPARLGQGLARLGQIVEEQGGRLSFGPGRSGGAVLQAVFGVDE